MPSLGAIERTGIVEHGQRQYRLYGPGRRLRLPKLQLAIAAAAPLDLEASVPSKIRAVLAVAAEITDTSIVDLLDSDRRRRIAWPRQFAYALLRAVRPDQSSLSALGRHFRRDHTTIMHGLRNAERRRCESPFREWFDDARVIALREVAQ